MKESTKYAALAFLFVLATIKGCVEVFMYWNDLMMWVKLPLVALMTLIGLLAFFFFSEFEACKKIEDENDKRTRFYNGGDTL